MTAIHHRKIKTIDASSAFLEVLFFFYLYCPMFKQGTSGNPPRLSSLQKYVLFVTQSFIYGNILASNYQSILFIILSLGIQEKNEEIRLFACFLLKKIWSQISS
jgi:hypothetical protein